MPRTETKKEILYSDIVIIGAGGAGLPAALSAVENGLSNVVMLEKRNSVGGNAARANGIFACGSRLQIEAGIKINGDDIFKKAMEWHHYDKVNPKILRSFINKSAETLQWLENKGIEFELKRGPFPPDRMPSWHVVKGTSPSSRFASAVNQLAKRCRDMGIKLLLRTGAKKIIPGANGNIVGVLANTGEKDIEIKTNAVIIATGGFHGNKALLLRYFPFYDEAFFTHSLTHTGDGVMMASEAGAAIEDFATMVREFCFSFDPGKNKPNRLAREPYTIWVNKKGERFIDETATNHINTCTNAIIQQPGKYAYCIYDDKMVQHVMEKGWLLGSSGLNRSADEPFPNFRNILVEEARNEIWAKISTSWFDIATWIGAVPEVLESTINEYNSFCDQKYDKDYLKEPRFLLPLRNPPYYAIKFRPLMIDTIGPIRINERMEVLDKQSRKIPGLYAAGVVTSGWQSYDYCGDLLFGSALGFSVYSGRVAGESAADYVKSKRD